MARETLSSSTHLPLETYLCAVLEQTGSTAPINNAPLITYVNRGRELGTNERKLKRKDVMLYLDSQLVEEAKERGINLSRLLEHTLRILLDRMKQVNLEDSSMNTDERSSTSTIMKKAGITSDRPLVRGVGFEPTKACATGSLIRSILSLTPSLAQMALPL